MHVVFQHNNMFGVVFITNKHHKQTQHTILNSTVCQMSNLKKIKYFFLVFFQLFFLNYENAEDEQIISKNFFPNIFQKRS